MADLRLPVRDEPHGKASSHGNRPTTALHSPVSELRRGMSMDAQPRRVGYLSTMISLAAAAFGVIAALAWNTAITELLNTYLPRTGGIIGLFLYAILVTVIAVVVMVNLGRAAERPND